LCNEFDAPLDAASQALCRTGTGMIVSAEMRWFWPTECPDRFEPWFQAGAPLPGLGCREDEYLHERDQTEIGIKRRGGRPGVEIKGLVAVLPESCDPAPFVGAAQIWCKWPSSALELRDLPTIKTKKKRWLRKFDMTGAEPPEIPMLKDDAPADHRPFPQQGCNVELTRIELEHEQVWWSFGFEAFGDLSSIERNLRAALFLMAERRPPPVAPGDLLSYPAWLDKHVGS
jgi:hypothetical protein